jgi:hypothetical protein
MRKLRKVEQEQVDAFVGPEIEEALPALHVVERVLIEKVLQGGTPNLARHALRDFMNLLGNEVQNEAELWIETHGTGRTLGKA